MKQASKPSIYADHYRSLIAIMLGRLRMNIDDCIREYETLGAKVFGHSRWFHLRSPLFWPRDKYNHKVLQETVRDVVKRYIPKVADFPGGRNFAFDENRCRAYEIYAASLTLSDFFIGSLLRIRSRDSLVSNNHICSEHTRIYTRVKIQKHSSSTAILLKPTTSLSGKSPGPLLQHPPTLSL